MTVDGGSVVNMIDLVIVLNTFGCVLTERIVIMYKRLMRRLCVIISIAFYFTSIVCAQEEHWMPDPNLRKAVRQELEIDTNTPLTKADMLRLVRLDTLGFNITEKITDLTGLEYAINLRALVLPRNRVRDLRQLTNLKEIHYLNLQGNQISDLSPLAGLVSLEVLGLSNNRIVDVSPLVGLVNLKTLVLNSNQIVDASPLSALENLESLEIYGNVDKILWTLPIPKLKQFGYDETCDLEGVPISERVENREYPSIFGAFGGGKILNLPELTWKEAWAYHDLTWSSLLFTSTSWLPSPEGVKPLVHIEIARKQREDLLSRNPNLIFIVATNYQAANPGEYPEDWPYWLRDESGNIIKVDRNPLIDFTYPEVQDYLVRQMIAFAKCGLFDGIFLDWWREEWQDSSEAQYYAYDVSEAAITMLRRMREGIDEVRDDFLIIANTVRSKIPRSAPYVNGTFMETHAPYSYTDLKEIEDTLLWSEQNFRDPQINCLEGRSDKTEPLDSPRNQQWMQLFTALSMTHSDGYVSLTSGIIPAQAHQHYWYDFYDAPLGHPVGGDETKGQLYENREGLFIREFTNGWAVYNRSGKEQEIEFPKAVSGVASGVKEKRLHVIPDLDGEIYLKSESGLETSPTADVNGDGVVNVLDLVAVANAIGKDALDINGDGTVNVLDLVAVANAF